MGKINEITGNILFTAPEIKENKGYTHKADVFAYGVTLFWLVTGLYPYEPLTRQGYADMRCYHVNNLKLLKEKIPAKLVTMILRCIHPEADKRCDFHQILSPFSAYD